VRSSSGVLARPVRGALAFETISEPAPGKPSLQRRRIGTSAHDDMITFTPEGDLITRLETELVSEVLGDDDLPLWAYLVSHT
jgi:hypothetical protein